MADFDEFLNAAIKLRSDFLTENVTPYMQETSAWLKDFEKFTKALVKAQKTGNYGPVVKANFLRNSRDSLKENNGPVNESIKTNSSDESGKTIQVKTEKISILPEKKQKDEAEEMPAPSMLPPKRRVKMEKVSNILSVKKEPVEGPERGRSTRTRAVERNSDLIIQNPVVPVVELSDSDEEKVETVRSTRTKTKKKAEAPGKKIVITNTQAVVEEQAPVRSTRTKTKKLQEAQKDAEKDEVEIKSKNKRDRSQEAETSSKKRSKSDSSDRNAQTLNVSGQTEYEDAVSDVSGRLGNNATFVLPKEKPENNPEQRTMDATIVVKKGKTVDDLLTDDESLEEPPTVSPQKKTRAAKKEVFSPYDRSPVKKKVEAFERFKSKDDPVSSKANTSRILKEIEGNKGNVREKASAFTPTSSKIRPKVASTSSASKIGKYTGYKNNDSTSFRSPMSGSKYTSVRERELKQQEREKELQKRAMVEEKKKINDEKLLKQEKERLKALEAQRLKEEKHKLLLKQQREKQRLLREENEKKRLQVKQRAAEQKKEEERRLAEQERLKELRKNAAAESLHKRAVQNATVNLPTYLREEPPLLPCNDCYDSDEEDSKVNKVVPRWATKEFVRYHLHIQEDLGHRLKNTVFCCQNQHVDLREIFERIDPKKLKRNSSAVWEKPPRYTMLLPLQ